MVSEMTTHASLLWAVLLIPPLTETFKPLLSPGGGSLTHRDITQRAIFRKTGQVCRAMATAQGQNFTLAIDDKLTAYTLQRACFSGGSSFLSALTFQTVVTKMYLSNAAVDVLLALSAPHHFDDETFVEGREVVAQASAAVKAAVKHGSFISARISLGAACHTLQDFYSHSNWIEMGNRVPFSKLIRPDMPLDNLAGPDRATCRNCTGGNCTNNILPDVLQEKILTSGYFSLFSSAKPAGKCSHGGSFDRTSGQDPVGGINKDDTSESHGHLHLQAAEVAINATMELLEDIRLATSDKDFLRLVGMSQSSLLSFVIDTTGSMADDIAEAKRVSFSVIDLKRGTQEEPSEYILVAFNDPGFGPLIRTSDADVFKQEINKLNAAGGGDIPEMCLSGLLLALTAAPPSSDIFVFTDAPAKDAELKTTVTALIESTKSKVTFMLTGTSSSARRRRSGSPVSRALSDADAQLYRDLAQASGGQAIEVSKSSLPNATVVIEDTSTSALVTLLQAVRTPVRAENFSFLLDETVSNVTVYITGSSSPAFTLYSPTGESQNHGVPEGPLGTIQRVGNLQRVQLNAHNRTGLWDITINSTAKFTVKVTGKNATLLMSVTGSDSLKVTELALVPVSGSGVVNGTVEAIGGGDFLVTIEELPAGDFTVHLKGETSGVSRSSPTLFQRQSSTQLRASSVAVTASVNSTLEPGATITVPFIVETNTTAGSYIIRARNDRGFSSSSPSSLTLEVGGRAEGTVTLTAPSDTLSGTDVTLTIEAEAPGAIDSNYVVVSFVVASRVTDFTRPVCQIVGITANCPQDCSQATWQLSASLSDGNGTGIASVTVQEGNGTLSTNSSGVGITAALYSASCCSQAVELVMVDNVGNAAICSASIRNPSSPTTAQPMTTTANATATPVSTTSSAQLCSNLSLWLWVIVVLPLLYPQA
ncbi:von Willebrand factor A domain-containing protein 7 isoform X2 [Alosa sapidissima]|uniref:von Willebrand factor A domain-containing protein 7 isoform X2 n=1 Tax=Alosa sapidissima TaxID=34773 RepID=UPI001C088119|nr:von Willebrand factor A domain-containing protein 7 isoform X2 [Alosa sapidissima]